jgi:2-phosphosulfolactate phosphatase
MTRKIHITLNARDIHEEDLCGKIAVVIDVLRATSVIVTAVSNGARWVKTVATIEEAFQLKSPDVILGGERQAMPIEGFDLGNSPLEYTSQRVSGKGIVLTTTNGTLALSRSGTAEEVLIGALLNHQAVADYLFLKHLPVELICAGTNGEFSLDDFLCAGLICSTLQTSGRFETDDLGKLAIRTWQLSSGDLHAALSGAIHYKVLKSKKLSADLDYCLQTGANNILVIRNKENNSYVKLQQET